MKTMIDAPLYSCRHVVGASPSGAPLYCCEPVAYDARFWVCDAHRAGMFSRARATGAIASQRFGEAKKRAAPV